MDKRKKSLKRPSFDLLVQSPKPRGRWPVHDLGQNFGHGIRTSLQGGFEGQFIRR